MVTCQGSCQLMPGLSRTPSPYPRALAPGARPFERTGRHGSCSACDAGPNGLGDGIIVPCGVGQWLGGVQQAYRVFGIGPIRIPHV